VENRSFGLSQALYKAAVGLPTLADKRALRSQDTPQAAGRRGAGATGSQNGTTRQ
jgi:hypothetical protein